LGIMHSSAITESSWFERMQPWWMWECSKMMHRWSWICCLQCIS
jgi:hypothetical protein